MNAKSNPSKTPASGASSSQAASSAKGSVTELQRTIGRLRGDFPEIAASLQGIKRLLESELAKLVGRGAKTLPKGRPNGPRGA